MTLDVRLHESGVKRSMKRTAELTEHMHTETQRKKEEE